MILISAVNAATYYVSTTGSDSNSCTAARNINTPKRSINSGIGCLSAGDTLYIRAGTYPEMLWANIPSGTSWNSPVTLAAYPGETVTLNPTAERVLQFQNNQQYIIIDRLILDGAHINRDVIKITYGSDPNTNAHHIRIQNSEIKNAPDNGILAGSYQGGNEYINNHVHHNGNHRSLDHGFYLGNPKNDIIRGNYIHDNSGYGIQIQYDGGINTVVENNWIDSNQGGGMVVLSDQTNLIIRNNIFSRNPGVGLNYGRASDSGLNPNWGATAAKIYSNTFYANGGNAIFVYHVDYGGGWAIGTLIKNNIFWQNSLSDPGGRSITDHNLVVDPKFLNAAGNDFHLQSSSPAINAGICFPEVPTDKDGVARPQGLTCDIGAYEYTGGVITQSPSFDFSLSNGGSKTVTQSSSVTNTITAALNSGTAQSVSFSALGLPSGTTSSFSPTSCNPTCTTTMTINTVSTTPTGTSTITVTGASGVTRTTSFTLTVNSGIDTTAPTVSLTSPSSGSTVSGTTTMTATASDNIGVNKVEFYVDGSLKGTDTISPYSFRWDTTNGNTHPCIGPHTHALLAKAYDASNNVGVSSTITVNMNNPSYCTGTTTSTVSSNEFVISFSVGTDTTLTTANPIGYWKFDETSGQALLDASGNSNSAVLGTSSSEEPSDPARVAGRINNGLSFTNSNSAVTISPSSSLNALLSFTYIAWIYPTGWGVDNPYGRIISKESANFDENFFTLNGPRTGLGVTIVDEASANYDSTTNSGAIALDAWQHVAVTYDAADRMPHLYINGQEVAYSQHPVLVGAMKLTSNPLIVGNRAALDRAFQGVIDELKIYNRALSQSEIQYDMNNIVSKASIPGDINNDGIVNIQDLYMITSYFGKSSFDSRVDVAATYGTIDIFDAMVVVRNWEKTGSITDTTAPTVSLTSPSSGSTVSGTTTMTATASDNVGVNKVEFYVDGSLKGTDISSPYSFSWDTTNGNTHPCIGPHTHSLVARAYDAANNVGVSSTVTVNMNNPSYCIDTPTPSPTPTPTPSPVSSNAYYVATNGNDGNSCATAQNINTPKRTITSGVACLTPGSTLYIRGGTYAEAFTNNIPSGTDWNAPVTIAAYGQPLNAPTGYGPDPAAEIVIMKPSDGNTAGWGRVMHLQDGRHHIIVAGLILDGANLGRAPTNQVVKITYGSDPATAAHHIRLRNNEIKNGPSDCILEGAHDIEILNNNIHHCGVEARDQHIYSGSTNVLIDHNLVHDGPGYGVQLQYTSSQGARVTRNVIYGMAAGAIVSYGRPSNALIANNVAYNNPGGGIYLAAAIANKVYNNIAYRNGGTGITYRQGVNCPECVGTIIRNNIAYLNGGGDFTVGEPLGYTQDHNLFGTDPKFVNAAGNDFHLQSTSPAINAGVTLSEVTKDFDGVARPQGPAYDIGAYEYTGGVIAQSPSFDFSLSNGGSKTVTQGSSVTNTITAALSSGTSQSVSFSASGLPSGATASFSQTSCSPSCTTTMTIRTSSTTPAGTYTITVTGTGSGVSKTTSFPFTVSTTSIPTITPSPITLSDSDFEIETFASGLTVPWSIDFLPDDRMVFTERTGAIKLRELSGSIRTIAQITSLYSGSESGVMGLAVDPSFSSTNHIYVIYTRTTGNRISRFTFDGSSLVNEVVILDNIPAASNHDGGRLKFGPDNKLYATTGDASNTALPQNLNSLAGKILRLNKDGSIPNDNPFNSYIWTYGHRNPQGLDWNPATGAMYSAEHGPTGNDELNLIIKGGNYGWPDIECNEIDSSIRQPIRCFSEFSLAPSGIAVYMGDIYMAGLRGNQLRRVVIDSNNKLVRDQALFTNFGRLRGITAHNGWLYFSTSNKDGRGSPASNDDRIFRARLKSANVQIPADTTPPISSSVASSSVTSNSATITWTTNEASDTQVEYGTTTAYGTSTTLNTNLVTSHSVSLSGLSASTTYHYRVKSKDAAGNLATSGDFIFTTSTVSSTGLSFDRKNFLFSHSFYGGGAYTNPQAAKELDTNVANMITVNQPVSSGLGEFIKSHNAGLQLEMRGSPLVSGNALDGGSASNIASQLQALGNICNTVGKEKVNWDLMPEWDQSGGGWVPGGRPRYTGLTWRQAYEKFKNHYFNTMLLATYLNQPSSQRVCQFASITDHNPNVFYAYEWGIDIGLIERVIDELADISTGIAYTRGAARQYDRPWGIDMSAWRTTANSLTQFNSAGIQTGGWSPNYMSRHMYIAYFAGAHIINVEPVWYYYNGDVNRLNSLGVAAKEFADFALKRHPDVGKTVVPLAMMMDFYNGFDPKHWIWTQYDAVWYGDIPYNDGDRMINNLFKVAYPDHWLHGLTPGLSSSLSSYISGGGDPRPYEPMPKTRWGDNLDVIMNNANSNALSNYKIILLTGGIVIDDSLRAKLDAWVRNGGILIANVKQVTSADVGLLGVTLSTTQNSATSSRWLADGTTYSEPSYYYYTVTPTTASVIADDNNGHPIVTRNAVGAGQVFLTTPLYLQDISKSQLLNIGKKLLDTEINLFAPATVDGNPIEYIVNRGNDKIVVMLVNNNGATWNGNVVMPIPSGSYSVNEWISDMPATSTIVGDKLKVTASVPPYGVKVYAVTT